MEKDLNMQENKVFSSNLKREQKPLKNNLYDLINVTPAKPVITVIEKDLPHCSFEPKTDKFYVPKKRTRFSRVKTVRDIRKLFETDEYTDLSADLEKQQHFLLKKITGGASKTENTKTLAKNMLKCEKPISRSAWQMLMNLNPDGYAHAIQYVLWNGRRIRVNGSKGGKSTFIYNYDLSDLKTLSKRKLLGKTSEHKKLLRNSLSIKFKPGPLSKKNNLDNSYQKYNVGEIELINLPKPGLDIRPVYGVVLEPTIANFLQELRDINGTISERWAELACSALGTVSNSGVIQNNEQSGVTFELKYKSNQNRLLMRRDLYSSFSKSDYSVNLQQNKSDESVLIPEIKNILNDIIDSVEISIQQDSFCAEDEPRDQATDTLNNKCGIITTKDKSKKKHCELNRLDVTVIRLPEVPDDDISRDCINAHCSLGCVCASLQCPYQLKQHCGRIECMFECKCDFSKYKSNNSFENNSHLLPGLIKLDNELNSRLAKEEQKFHQTVVVTGEKSILLKSQKRNWKAPKRYGDFYRHMSLKNDLKSKQVLSVSTIKLNVENIEPWCMVHNLYKCFCKGKFTQAPEIHIEKVNETIPHEDEPEYIKNSLDNKNSSDNIKKSLDRKYSNKLRCHSDRTNTDKNIRKKTLSENSDVSEIGSTIKNESFTCARVKPYNGRKFYDAYYTNTNKKILEMERNDDHLRKKMLLILNNVDKQDEIDPPNKNLDKGENNDSSFKNTIQDKTLETTYNINLSPERNLVSSGENSVSDSLTEGVGIRMQSNDGKLAVMQDNTRNRSMLHRISNKNNMKTWLETSFKLHKQRLGQGFVKQALDPPKHGRVTLYSWEFILNRYKERKNLFLISKQKPFRIFMAVDAKHSFFQNCMNIDDIRFADLHKYPVAVKNLLTNSIDPKDNYCILCGLSHCWELVGSVTKMDEPGNSSAKFKNICDSGNQVQSDSSCDSNPEISLVSKSLSNKQVQLHVLSDEKKNETDNNSIESSKWFVMTVENDFSEIQFHLRGFFVKYESIIKAINVARISGKTVRLSSQKCTEQNTVAQFGIYAIPNANEYCVFVGPYDKDEPLGIETLKSVSTIGKNKRTRGVWITTKKVDNVKVIDNPLSFMPPTDLPSSKVVSLECEPKAKQDLENFTGQKTIASEEAKPKELPTKEEVKKVKPIKIRKTNGFYQLPQEQLTQITVPRSSEEIQVTGSNENIGKEPLLTSILKPPLPPLNYYKASTSKSPFCLKLSSSIPNDPSSQITRPVAEIAPQIKILNVLPECPTTQANNDKTEKRKPECGMFVLKPEEINKRVLESSLQSSTELTLPKNYNSNTRAGSDIDQDIENFLATSVVCVSPNADIFVISDEDDSDHATVRNVWIECQNYEFLGWIKGRKNEENLLSFEFPGFKFTDFYNEEEAFCKINQVLSRKVCVPKNINLQWRVIETAEELKVKHKLNADDLGPDFVITKRGLRHKRDLIISSTNKRPYSLVDKISDLEEQSQILEEENDKLMQEMARKSLIMHHVPQVSHDHRKQITDNLQSILAANKEDSSSSSNE